MNIDNETVIALAKLQSNYLKVRAALVNLVGSDDPKVLESMEFTVRSIPAPAEDKAHTIDAIHALRDTQQ